MPIDGTPRRFGRRGEPNVEVPLPKKFITHDRRCVLSLDTISTTDISDWYKVWAAAVAIQVMCVEAKQASGKAPNLGKSSYDTQFFCWQMPYSYWGIKEKIETLLPRFGTERVDLPLWSLCWLQIRAW